ncbi:class II aldolase/adducin domain-containing protein [Streptomyces laurentii]|uniref:Class II aldolase/adducin domain-containing protein n=1 Tax=Streptomyces laurentii TaxID=39478 RepID=A0A160NZD3_STRLU|nr:class II aldolase/adducin domain-containing protein [Streptomyces laurentii]
MTTTLTTALPAADVRDVKDRLVAGIRLFGALGYGHGLAGYFSAADPRRPGHYWVNPLGVDFTEVRADDLLLVDPLGEVREGPGTLNPSVDALHGELHRARPDLTAFAHTHSRLGKAWSTLGRRLDPITQDACLLFGRHEVYERFGGPVTDRQEGKEIARTLGGGSAVVLQSHGWVTGGRSVAEAAWLHVAMERAADVQILAESVGTPRRIPEDVARATGAMLSRLEYAERQFTNLCRSTGVTRDLSGPHPLDHPVGHPAGHDEGPAR